MTAPLAERVATAGMSAAAAERKARLFEAANRALAALGGEKRGESLRWYVPGRIEVLGKHTDYAGGRSLLCAVERGFCVAARPRSDRVMRIADAVRKTEAEILLSPDAVAAATGWTVYPATVARRIAQNFSEPLRGADIAFASDLPPSAGMSSSSALVVSVFAALSAVNGLDRRREFTEHLRRPEDLAGYLGCIENGQGFGALAGDRGVGTFGGSEDHTAILCCRAGHVSGYSFCPVRAEGAARLPPGWTFVVGVSGVAADKTGSARDRYNRASLTARAVLELWRDATGRDDATLAAAATHAPDAPERIREILRRSSHPEFPPQALLDRFEQFFEESERIIPAAAAALAEGNAGELAALVERSQAGAERLLGNQIPETVELVRSARELGAIAASAFGAGFGGSVWALVPRARAWEFRAAWEERYHGCFPEAARTSEFFVTGAGPGMLRL